MGKKTDARDESTDPAVEAVLNADNLFEILGIELTELEAAGSDEAMDAIITKKYRQVSLGVHPDRCRSPKSADASQMVNLAYERLSDADARREYIALFKRGEGSFKSGFNVHHADSGDDLSSFVNEIKSQFKNSSGLARIGLGFALVLGSLGLFTLFFCARTPFHYIISQVWFAYIFYNYFAGDYGLLATLLLRLPLLVVVCNIVVEVGMRIAGRLRFDPEKLPTLVQAIPLLVVRGYCEMIGPLYGVMLHLVGYRAWLCVVAAAVIGVLGRLVTRALL